MSRGQGRSAGPRRSGAGGRLGLIGLGGYAVVTATIGVLLVLGFGPGMPGQADRVRSVVAAPVLPVLPVLPVRPAPLRTAAAASPAVVVPSAQLARSTQAGDPFRPAELILPGGAGAPVTSSGLHPDGALVIPDDPAVVGWWNGGALAGDAFGSVVIAGHVDSARYGLGVMAQLRTLRPGQVVELRSGARRRSYRVASRTSLPQAELAARSDAFRQDIPPRLVLITCGGAFDPVRHRYQDNLVIYALPI